MSCRRNTPSVTAPAASGARCRTCGAHDNAFGAIPGSTRRWAAPPRLSHTPLAYERGDSRHLFPANSHGLSPAPLAFPPKHVTPPPLSHPFSRQAVHGAYSPKEDGRGPGAGRCKFHSQPPPRFPFPRQTCLRVAVNPKLPKYNTPAACFAGRCRPPSAAIIERTLLLLTELFRHFYMLSNFASFFTDHCIPLIIARIPDRLHRKIVTIVQAHTLYKVISF